MTEQEHLLTILGEECAEVHQRCSKALRFGMDEVQPGQDLSNKERILEELNDLFAVAAMVFDKPLIELVNVTMFGKKLRKVKQYLTYSKECGTVQG